MLCTYGQGVKVKIAYNSYNEAEQAGLALTSKGKAALKKTGELLRNSCLN
jgi:hypothetical protein